MVYIPVPNDHRCNDPDWIGHEEALGCDGQPPDQPDSNTPVHTGPTVTYGPITPGPDQPQDAEDFPIPIPREGTGRHTGRDGDDGRVAGGRDAGGGNGGGGRGGGRAVVARPPNFSNNRSSRSYTVPRAVPGIQQKSPSTCWGAAATAMVSWKDNQTYAIENVLKKAGPYYETKYAADQGLDANTEIPGFLSALGLVAEPPMSFTVDQWENLLKSYGPLWVTVLDHRNKPDFSHSVVVDGIYGEFTSDKETNFHFMDPQIGTGRPQSFSDFIDRYENVPGSPSDVVFQVFHFPR